MRLEYQEYITPYKGYHIYKENKFYSIKNLRSIHAQTLYTYFTSLRDAKKFIEEVL